MVDRSRKWTKPFLFSPSARQHIQAEKQESTRTEYFTDEEELAKETEWIVQKKGNTRNRKMDISFTLKWQPNSEQQTKHAAAESI